MLISNSEQSVKRLSEAQIIAVLRNMSFKKTIKLTEILVQAGVSAIEITMDATEAPEILQYLRKTYGSALWLGAGTILSQEDAQKAQAAGAEMLISPHWDLTLYQVAKRLMIPYVPGVLTPTEIMQAQKEGVNLLKLFPAGSLGVAYFKDLLGPFSRTLFIPTGGITVQMASDFLQAGALAIGMGSGLIPKKQVEQEDWLGVQQILEDNLALIRERLR